MANLVVDTRMAKLRDIPLVHRLAEHGTVLDSELGCTRVADAPDSAAFTSILLPQRGLHTLLARSGKEHVVGQFRLKTSDHLAQMVYIAPGLDTDGEDTTWLHMLDAMAAEAGKRGAHILTAEVDEGSRLFQTLRTAGYAVYARQEIWRRMPEQGAIPLDCATLHDETDADAMDVQLLYANIVPRLVQHIAVPATESAGLVYRHGDRIQGYVAVSEGRYGVYLVPYLHPDIPFSEVSAILAGAIARASRADKVPVYLCMRRYQDWLEEALVELEFERWSEQAVMVRHIAAGIRQAAFAPLSRKLEAIPSPIRPPSQVTEPVLERNHQE